MEMLESIEKLNVAKILIKNYGEACHDLGFEKGQGNSTDDTAVNLTATQLFKFMVKLIEENDRYKSGILNLKETLKKP